MEEQNEDRALREVPTRIRMPNVRILELASQDANLDELKACLDRDPNLINVTDSKGNNIIFKALLQKCPNIFEELASRKPELLSSQYQSEMHRHSNAASLIIEKGFFDMLETLHKYSPNEFNRIDNDGTNPLQLATRLGKFEVVKDIAKRGEEYSGINAVIKLIPGGAKTFDNVRNRRCSTALHIAIEEAVEEGSDREGFEEVIGTLIENGADPKVKNRLQQNALNFSCSDTKMHPVASLLLSIPDVDLGIDEQDIRGYSSVLYATWLDNAALFKDLVEKGAVIDDTFRSTKEGPELPLEHFAGENMKQLIIEQREKNAADRFPEGTPRATESTTPFVVADNAKSSVSEL